MATPRQCRCSPRSVTAGASSFAARGFTIDPHTRIEYVDTLRTLADRPPLGEEERRRAEQFAYALRSMRPLRLDARSLASRDAHADGDCEVTPPIEAWARWLATDEEDFLA